MKMKLKTSLISLRVDTRMTTEWCGEEGLIQEREGCVDSKLLINAPCGELEGMKLPKNVIMFQMETWRDILPHSPQTRLASLSHSFELPIHQSFTPPHT